MTTTDRRRVGGTVDLKRLHATARQLMVKHHVPGLSIASHLVAATAARGSLRLRGPGQRPTRQHEHRLPVVLDVQDRHHNGSPTTVRREPLDLRRTDRLGGALVRRSARRRTTDDPAAAQSARRRRRTPCRCAGFSLRTSHRWPRGIVARLLQRLAEARTDGGARYSNLGFLVLAEIIARSAGEPFESTCTTQFWNQRGCWTPAYDFRSRGDARHRFTFGCPRSQRPTAVVLPQAWSVTACGEQTRAALPGRRSGLRPV